MAMIAIGYKYDDLSLVDEKYRMMELSERKRKPIENNFYNSKWKNPITIKK